MLSIKKLEHVDDICFRELFGRIRMFFNEIRTFTSKVYGGHHDLVDCLYMIPGMYTPGLISV
jgi:hypothetical protein